MNPKSSLAALLFVVPAEQAFTDDPGDVLRVPVPMGDARINGKYHLQNAFFRFAVLRRPPPQFIARADDDAAFNASSMALYLARFCRRFPDLHYSVYGPQRDWYMWHRRSMQAACISTSWRRWLADQQQWRLQHPGAKGFQMSAAADWSNVSQCLRPGLSGPFPFTAGPFVAYSFALAQLLVTHGTNVTAERAESHHESHPSSRPAAVGLMPPHLTRLERDEQWVLSERRRVPLHVAFTGRTVEPTAPNHPSRGTMFEEVYYASLIHELLQDEPVVLLHAWLSEYKGGNRRGEDSAPFVLGKSLFPAHVYHNLKKPSRFRSVEAHSERLLRTVTPGRLGKCRPLVTKSRLLQGYHPQVRALADAPLSADTLQRTVCCTKWLRCEPLAT